MDFLDNQNMLYSGVPYKEVFCFLVGNSDPYKDTFDINQENNFALFLMPFNVSECLTLIKTNPISRTTVTIFYQLYIDRGNCNQFCNCCNLSCNCTFTITKSLTTVTINYKDFPYLSNLVTMCCKYCKY